MRIAIPPLTNLVRHLKCDVNDRGENPPAARLPEPAETDLPGRRLGGVFKAITQALDDALDFYFTRSRKNNLQQNVAFDLLSSSFIRVNRLRLEKIWTGVGLGARRYWCLLCSGRGAATFVCAKACRSAPFRA